MGEFLFKGIYPLVLTDDPFHLYSLKKANEHVECRCDAHKEGAFVNCQSTDVLPDIHVILTKDKLENGVYILKSPARPWLALQIGDIIDPVTQARRS